MTEQDRLRLCIEHIYWDLIDAYGVTRGRKNELTFVTGIILTMSAATRLRMQDIASALHVSRSTVTDYVDYLEKHGYVRRERGSEDRRDVLVVPTDKGLERVKKVTQTTFSYVDEGMGRLTTEEKARFLELLSKFIGDAEQPPYARLLNGRIKKD